MLAYLDSPDSVPEKDVDRMHIRDNLKIATVSEQTPPTPPKMNRNQSNGVFFYHRLVCDPHRTS